MVEASNCKVVPVILPVAILDDASWTTAEIDTKGWEYGTWYFMLGATDIALTALKLTESDASGSGHADITDTVFGTANNDTGSASTLPSATDDGKVFAIDLDLKGRKRYIDAVATIGNGAAGGFIAAWCVLSRGHKMPVSATDRGLAQVLRVA